jgi:hypothetical protein
MWKLKLTVELASGESVEHDVTEWRRGEAVDLASLGLARRNPEEEIKIALY